MAETRHSFIFHCLKQICIMTPNLLDGSASSCSPSSSSPPSASSGASSRTSAASCCPGWSSGPSSVWARPFRPLAHLWLLHLPRGGVRCPGGLCLDVLQHLLLVGRQEPLQECQMVPESRY